MNTETPKDQLHEQGYLIIRNIIDDTLLKQTRDLVSRIILLENKVSDDVFRKYYLPHRTDQGVLYDLYQRYPIFRNMISHPKVIEGLKVALGENFYMYENSLIYKPKGKRNAVPWHQDFISRPTEPIKFITWMPLDDVNENNGTLKIIPGSHSDGFLPWYRVSGETHHDRVKPEVVDQHTDKVKYIDLCAGDVLIFNMLLLHSSDEIHTDVPRRVYRASFQSMDNQINTPRGSPLVIAGGEPEYLIARETNNLQEKIKSNKNSKNKFVCFINKVGRKLACYGDEKSNN